jgi:hypothetical protein
MGSELVMRVSRDAHNRLSGTVSPSSAGEDLPFSGTLELLRILEDLVPDGTEPDPKHGTAGR